MARLSSFARASSIWTGLLVLVATRPCNADHCEIHEQEPASSTSAVYARADWEVVRYKNTRYEGHFEGVAAEAGAQLQGFQLTARLPAYRLLRNGLPVQGVGDLSVSARQVVWQSLSAHQEAGLLFATSLPTGNPDQDLGMGHVMIMPGVYARFDWGSFETLLAGSYARAITGSGSERHHQHDSAYFPIVQPMNISEFSGSLLLLHPLVAGIAIRGRLTTAEAVAETATSNRTIAGLGASQRALGVTTFVEWQSPILGRPFTSRVFGGVAFSH